MPILSPRNTTRALALSTILALGGIISSAQTFTAPPATTHTCLVVTTPPTIGENALASENYDAALAFYRATVATDPTSEEAHLGLVRALIGKDQVADALKESAETLKRSPRSAIAEVAAADAAFRNADFDSTRTHIQQALQYDICEGRAQAALARLYSIHALFAMEARVLVTAHKLRPNDELIRREWIESLPRKERAVELAKYLGGANALSDRDRNGFTNQEDHLNARRPGECRITSRTDSVKIPFLPVSGDINHPIAYGLDVTFNGKRRRLQVDTGASGIVLTPSAAKSLHLEPEYHLHTGGVGDEGKVESYLTHVASIQIGGVEISDCMVEVLQKSKIGVDGLIGIDTFSRWLATLDYPGNELRLTPLPPRPPDNLTDKPAPGLNTPGAEDQQVDDERLPHDAIVPPGMQDWLHIIRFGHELLLPSHLNLGPLRYLMADTGAGSTLFSLAAAKEAGKPRLNSDARFTGVSGNVAKVYFVDNINLIFGKLRLPPRSFPAFDITNVSHDTGTEVSGFVGLETLSRLTITIDYRDNLMLLKYDPNHDIQRF